MSGKKLTHHLVLWPDRWQASHCWWAFTYGINIAYVECLYYVLFLCLYIYGQINKEDYRATNTVTFTDRDDRAASVFVATYYRSAKSITGTCR